MKIALVITDGLRNITLTPETDEETKLLELMHSAQWDLSIKRGQFFISRGDYPRFGTWSRERGSYGQNDSTMLVLRPAASTEQEKALIGRLRNDGYAISSEAADTIERLLQR